MKKRFIDRFEVLLLDMGRTFMFDVDRFEKSDGLEITYRNAGGTTLNNGQVYETISEILDAMTSDRRDPAKYEHYPSVKSYVDSSPVSRNLDENEKKILEKVIAVHEIGTIPPHSSTTVKELAKTHRLGVVSDVWSQSGDYLLELERAGINKLFETTVFSSDIDIIKPSPKIFQKAADAFDVDESKMVYVGDSLFRDVKGAKDFGMAAVWIQRNQIFDGSIAVEPDLIVNELQDILSA